MIANKKLKFLNCNDTKIHYNLITMDQLIIQQLNLWKSRQKENSIKIDDKYYTLPGQYNCGKYYNDRSVTDENYRFYKDGTGIINHAGYDSTFFNWKIKDGNIIRHCYRYLTYNSDEKIDKTKSDKFEFTKVFQPQTRSYYLHIKFEDKIYYRKISPLFFVPESPPKIVLY
jgi:hypothetical protein